MSAKVLIAADGTKMGSNPKPVFPLSFRAMVPYTLALKSTIEVLADEKASAA
jgi:hypothetical protein